MSATHTVAVIRKDGRAHTTEFSGYAAETLADRYTIEMRACSRSLTVHHIVTCSDSHESFERQRV